MLEVMHFIFSSFWVWAGTVFLIAVVGAAVCAAAKGFKGS